MKVREKYIIVIKGEAVEVTPEIYQVYYRAERKERYFLTSWVLFFYASDFPK